jgi:hypothetical protein
VPVGCCSLVPLPAQSATPPATLALAKQRAVGKFYERFCNTSAILKGGYLLVFTEGIERRLMRIAPSYIRAIVLLCEPLTHREPHRSIAFTGRNCWSSARRKREASHEPSRLHRQAVD